MNTNLVALLAAIKCLADAANDTVAALKPGQSAVARLAAYYNLIPDIESLVPQIGLIPAEVAALQPADYVSLTSSLVADLAISDVKAQAIIAASLKLLTDIALTVVPDVQALLSAIKTTPPVPAAS